MRKSILLSIAALSMLASHHVSALGFSDITSKEITTVICALLACKVLSGNNTATSQFIGAALFVAAGVNQFVFELKDAKKVFTEWNATRAKSS